MLLVNLLACGAGIGAGLVAAWLSIAGSRRLGNDGFWRQLRAFGRLLLSPDSEDSLFREYIRLWPVLFAFTAKKLALGLITLAPVALAFGCLTLLDSGLQDARAAVHDDDNLLSPYVNQWELYFFAAVCLTSVAAWLAARFKA